MKFYSKDVEIKNNNCFFVFAFFLRYEIFDELPTNAFENKYLKASDFSKIIIEIK